MARGNAGHLPPVSAKANLQTVHSAVELVGTAACGASGYSDSGHEEKQNPDFDIGDEVEAQWMEPADDGEERYSCLIGRFHSASN
jgi:hypothetical protein